MRFKTVSTYLIMIGIISAFLITGCGGSDKNEADVTKPVGEEAVGNDRESESDKSPEISSAEKDEQPDEKEEVKALEETSDKMSLAKRMTGKYSYHYPGENGEEEFFIMDVVNFGDNLYAYCGQAMAEDYESFEAYTFWATEFIPYDADEMASTDGDSVKVNELNFSIMSNAGKYWDSGHSGTITLTDDGLVFEGFDHDGFLVPDYDDSRLFLKDKRVEDAFSYLKHDDLSGDDKLTGYWVYKGETSDLYLYFSGSDLYMYQKSPDEEVFFAAGACDLHDTSFECRGNLIQNGGMPFEFTADYKVEEDSLFMVIQGSDAPYQMPGEAEFERISESDVHVTTMDEIVFNEDSFGPFGQMESEPFYGVWVNAFKEESDAKALVAEIADKGLPSAYVYSCDWENLNKEPYYCVTVGRSALESEAKSYLEDAKKAGYVSAYIKHTGDRINR